MTDYCYSLWLIMILQEVNKAIMSLKKLFAICLSCTWYGSTVLYEKLVKCAVIFYDYKYNVNHIVGNGFCFRLIQLCDKCNGLALVQGLFLFLIFVVFFSKSPYIYETKNYFKIYY